MRTVNRFVRLDQPDRAPDALRDEGVVLVWVALMLVVLVGMGALVIDIGALYVEKRELQNGADAAALAVARDCVEGDCGSGGYLSRSRCGESMADVRPKSAMASGMFSPRASAAQACRWISNWSTTAASRAASTASSRWACSSTWARRTTPSTSTLRGVCWPTTGCSCCTPSASTAPPPTPTRGSRSTSAGTA